MIRSLYMGLTLPDELARRFPHDARRGAPHVTVLYCADVEASADDVMAAITSAVAGMGPIPITISDTVIQLGPPDAPVAAATIADDLRLRLLRLAIRAELDAMGIDHPQTFAGYDPHATIRALADGETVDDVKSPGGAESVGVLTVRVDGVEHLVTLGPARAQLSREALSAAVVSTWRDAVAAIAAAVGAREDVTTPDDAVRDVLWSLVAVVDPDPLVRASDGAIIEGAEAVLLMAKWLREVLAESGRLGYVPSDVRAAVAELAADVPSGRVELRSMRWGQDLQAEADARAICVEVPAGWIIGRPFRCLAVGEIHQRVDGARCDAGEMRGQPITADHLASIVRLYESGEAIPINREHQRDCPEGDVIACWLVDGGQALAVLPAYTPDMAEYVARSSGALWSSPEIAWGPTHDAASGELVGSMLMDGLAICTHPAQAHRKLDRVRLSADADNNRAALAVPTTEEEAIMDEELKAMLTAIMARLDALEAAKAEPEDEGDAPAAEGEGDAPAEDEQMTALKAEVAALKAAADQAKAEKLAAEQGAAVRELLTSGRITPAEKAAAEKVVSKGGVELLSAVYGDRKPSQAVPSRKSHDQKVDVPTGEEGSAAHKAVTEFLSSDAGAGYDYVTAAAHIESAHPELFAR